jgi:hypothetical protein
MHSINRQVAIIKPKAPYQNWINSLPGMDKPCDMEELGEDCTAILLPHFEGEEESLKYIKSILPKIFEIELDSWNTDRSTWPKKRNYALFQAWFKVELYSEVLDFTETDIEKEAY